MIRRRFSVLFVAAAIFALAPLAGSGQTQTGGDDTWTLPRTVDGQPDLQGRWTMATFTPLERPERFADREFLTEEEAAELRDLVTTDGTNPLARNLFGETSDNQRRENTVQTKENIHYDNAIWLTEENPKNISSLRTSLVVDPPNGRIPALTTEAKRDDEIQREWRVALMQNTPTCEQQARACEGGEFGPISPHRFDVPPFYNTNRMNRHDGPEDQSLGDRCMRGVTPDFRGHRRIVQGEDSIAIAYDTGQGQGYQRVVYLSGNHPPAQLRLRHGDSRGHWEGNTLVIETTNFSPKFPFRGSGENLKLVERYTRVDDETLDYEVTVEDPTVWSEPWTIRQEMKSQNGTENRIYYEPRCHEGNYGLYNILAAAGLR